MPKNPTRTIKLQLTEAEYVVLRFVIELADPNLGDPMKDFYEVNQGRAEDDKIEDPYEVLESLVGKLPKWEDA